MSKFITLATFTYPQEAYVAKSRLEAEGITVFLKNELTIQTDNFLSNAMGGVQLQVHTDDVEVAIQIIKDFDLLPPHMIDQGPEAKPNPDTWTSRIPLIRKFPRELRVFVMVAIVLLFGVIVILLLTAPTKEERMTSRAYNRQMRAYSSLVYKYRDIIDDSLYANPEFAKTHIRRLLKQLPNNEELNLFLGIALFEQDSFALALEAFEKKKRHARFDHSRDYYNIGMTKIHLMDFNGAMENLNVAANKIKKRSGILLGFWDDESMFIYGNYGISEYWVYWNDSPIGLENHPDLLKQYAEIRKIVVNESD